MSVNPPFLAVGQYQANTNVGIVTIYSCTTSSCSSTNPYTVPVSGASSFGYSVSAVNGMLAISAPTTGSTGGAFLNKCFFF